MKLRAVTALVLIPLGLYLIVWSPAWLFIAALLLVVEGSAYEYFQLSRHAGLGGFPWVGYAGSAALCLAQVADLRWPGDLVMILTVSSVLGALSVALISTGDLRQYFAAACSTLFCILYVGLTLSCLIPLRLSSSLQRQASPEVPPDKVLLFLFAVIWAGDIFAYLTGRWLGRKPIFPRISPKKTLEGSLGGLAGSLLTAGVLARWWSSETQGLKTVMLLAGIVAVAGQVGDLAESALKRSADVKDSGTLLPGHGGLLDRMDSLIFGAPALWVALALMRFRFHH
jgi:phosphatidate cytidylyltransferase